MMEKIKKIEKERDQIMDEGCIFVLIGVLLGYLLYRS
jgi:hypothetical protein